jgi:hypothetical protein
MILVSPELVEKAVNLVFSAEPSVTQIRSISDLSEGTLRTAFRKGSMQFHPDRAGVLGLEAGELEERFKRFLGAYRLLNRLASREIDIAIQRTNADENRSTPHSTPRRPASRQPASRQRPAGTWGDINGNGRHSQRRSHAPRGKGIYRGVLPKRPLRFAQFLYYAGVIDWQMMIDAITWQMHVRPKIGEIGRAYHFFDYHGVGDIIRAREVGELFGSTALRIGRVNRFQLNAMVGKQLKHNLPIGRYFLEKGLLGQVELSTLLERNRRHNSAVRTVYPR